MTLVTSAHLSTLQETIVIRCELFCVGQIYSSLRGFGRVLEYIIKGLWTSLSCTERAWPVCGVLSLWGQFMTYDQLTNFSQRLNC